MGDTLRNARRTDLAALEIVRRQAIEAAFADEFDRSTYADSVAMPSSELSGWIGDEEVAVLLLETAVTPVAFGAADRGAGIVLALYTAPDYWRRGYGSTVLAGLENELRTGNDEIVANVPVTAPGFFEANGYRVLAGVDGEEIPHVECRKCVDA